MPYQRHASSMLTPDFVNKSKTFDYRMTVPLFHLGRDGQLDEVPGYSRPCAATLMR